MLTLAKFLIFGIFLGNYTLNSNISRTAWLISVIHISFFRISNSIIFSPGPSPSLPNWLRYGECGEDPAVRQESDDPTSCHRGRRDGRFLNPSRTCIVDKWLQTHPERAGKSCYSCGRLALVPREPIYVKYLCPA